MADEIPKGRLQRGLALMKLAAKELPMVGERLMTPGGFREQDVVRLKASAEQAARVLGDLRGLALKLGQTASYVDGLLPEHATEAYQKALARLQSAAPTVPFDKIREEVERGLGRSLESAFVRFDETPIAAASIGQVHRAAITDADGQVVEVAVKVQYPGIAHALTSDLKNLEVLRPLIAMLAPGADTKGGMTEVVDRLAEELDYHREADNQERFAAMVEGFDDVVIPKVYRTHLGRNVITTAFVEGRSVRDVSQNGDEELRNRVGAAIFRFTLGCAFTRGAFNTDPHPGNYIVQHDGRTAFLDFGSVKWLPEELHRKWRSLATMLVEGRIEDWKREGASLMGMEHMDPRAREINQQFMLYTSAMLAEDRPVRIDRSLLRGAVDEGIASAKKIIKEVGVMPSRAKTMRIPPDMVMIGRMQVGLFAVLAQLRPEANWNRILKELLAKTR